MNKLYQEIKETLIAACYMTAHDGEYDEQKAREEYLGIPDTPVLETCTPKLAINKRCAIVDKALSTIIQNIETARAEETQPPN